MAMLLLNGTLQNVFTNPESKDKKTGEVRPAAMKAQLLAENITPSGEMKFEMVTLTVHSPAYRDLVGQKIRVPVGAFVANGAIMYYSLRNESQPILA